MIHALYADKSLKNNIMTSIYDQNVNSPKVDLSCLMVVFYISGRGDSLFFEFLSIIILVSFIASKSS
jgi:hypothetical protein